MDATILVNSWWLREDEVLNLVAVAGAGDSFHCSGVFCRREVFNCFTSQQDKTKCGATCYNYARPGEYYNSCSLLCSQTVLQEWSDELAIAAQLYASQCSSINPLFREEDLGFDGFGANVAIGEGPSYSIPSLISQWEGQKSHYNYYCDTCDFGKCKRIKQVIMLQ